MAGTCTGNCDFPCELFLPKHKASRARMRSSDDCQGRSNSDNRENVLRYRPRKPAAGSGKRTRDVSKAEIIRLLDLSKYEKPQETPDEFKARMTENVAALIALGVFIGIAAIDFSAIEQLQCGAAIWKCLH